MKRFFVLLLVVGCFVLFTNNYVVAEDVRLATCDLCGYCRDFIPTPPQQNPPGNWEKCRECLYENARTDPTLNDTLIVDDTNMPPTPIPGHWYTMLGCISTSLDSFQADGAASSVVQKLLNLIFGATGVIGLAYFVYGSGLILTSQAEPEKLGQGKRFVVGAIVGIIFSLGSVFIVNLLASGVLKIPGFGGP